MMVRFGPHTRNNHTKRKKVVEMSDEGCDCGCAAETVNTRQCSCDCKRGPDKETTKGSVT